MKNQTDWNQIFLQCKNNIQEKIQPFLKTLRQPQPNLGLGAGGDIMKPVDLAAEKAIVETLRKNNIAFIMISEESGFKKFFGSTEQWYLTIDPIDGTTNLTHGLPFYASSIAVSKTPELGDVCAGMVTDLCHDVMYTAFKGEGAFRNEERITTSKTTSLDDAVINIDLNTYKANSGIPKLAALIENTRHIRHFGANALELCYVANGLIEAFIDLRGRIRTTDVAAGFLIAKESGAIITTIDNKEINAKLHPKQALNFVASANKQIHQEIINLVQP